MVLTSRGAAIGLVTAATAGMLLAGSPADAQPGLTAGGAARSTPIEVGLTHGATQVGLAFGDHHRRRHHYRRHHHRRHYYRHHRRHHHRHHGHHRYHRYAASGLSNRNVNVNTNTNRVSARLDNRNTNIAVARGHSPFFGFAMGLGAGFLRSTPR